MMQTCHLEMMLRSRYVGSIIGNNMYCICQYIYHFQLIRMSTSELCHKQRKHNCQQNTMIVGANIEY